MPTSNISQVVKIMEVIKMANPVSILDIGVGFGKYGFLAREYLELWDGSDCYKTWRRRIDGIEIFSGYITPVHHFIYNEIYIGNTLEILPNITEKYDLILLIDVIEHFTFEEGMTLLNLAKARAKTVLISTPKHIGVQGSVFGNSFETHKFQWEKSNFSNFRQNYFIKDRESIIVCLGEFATKLHESRLNRFIGKALPFLVRPTRAIKSYLKR
jgi:hypothetical protein